MRFLFLLMLVLAFPVFAEEAKQPAPIIAVPEITFAQKVDMVVTAKQDPRVLDVKIDQKNQKVDITVIVDQNQDREEAKELAQTMIMQVKSKCLDDAPKDKKEPGKGLYDYQLSYYRPDGIALLTAIKEAKEAKLRFEDPNPVVMPATRADEAGR